MSTEETKAVQLDASCVLRILRHVGGKTSTVSGPLLGLDINDRVLKVSHSYPFPSVGDSNPYKNRGNVEYETQLLDQLKESGVAVEPLGWYQSSISGRFLTESVVDSLAEIQLKRNKNSVLVVHDAARAKYGVLSLRAFRLSSTFLELYGQHKSFSLKDVLSSGLTADNFLVEVPIEVHNSALVSLYLSQQDPAELHDGILQSSVARTKTTLVNLDNLVDSIEDVNNFFYQLNKKRQSLGEVNLKEWLVLNAKLELNVDELQQQIASQLVVDKIASL